MDYNYALTISSKEKHHILKGTITLNVLEHTPPCHTWFLCVTWGGTGGTSGNSLCAKRDAREGRDAKEFLDW